MVISAAYKTNIEGLCTNHMPLTGRLQAANYMYSISGQMIGKTLEDLFNFVKEFIVVDDHKKLATQ